MEGSQPPVILRVHPGTSLVEEVEEVVVVVPVPVQGHLHYEYLHHLPAPPVGGEVQGAALLCVEVGHVGGAGLHQLPHLPPGDQI